MAMRLNHVTLGTDNARALSDFYRNVVGLEPTLTLAAQSVNPDAYKWFKIGDKELHIVERDESIAERLSVPFSPLKTHIAIEVDSLEEIEQLTERLTKAGVQWMDWSMHGIAGKGQTFMIDLGGNVVEFQVASQNA
jgi:catechol 2,3-dioxygenase-like lactoylglutathione lyase family enzyme